MIGISLNNPLALKISFTVERLLPEAGINNVPFIPCNISRSPGRMRSCESKRVPSRSKHTTRWIFFIVFRLYPLKSIPGCLGDNPVKAFLFPGREGCQCKHHFKRNLFSLSSFSFLSWRREQPKNLFYTLCLILFTI